jgi:DNA-binding transcriptional LysR family regulator
MPTFIVAPHLAKGDLVTVLDDFSLQTHAIYAIYPDRKHLPEKVKVFINFIKQKLRAGLLTGKMIR